MYKYRLFARAHESKRSCRSSSCIQSPSPKNTRKMERVRIDNVKSSQCICLKQLLHCCLFGRARSEARTALPMTTLVVRRLSLPARPPARVCLNRTRRFAPFSNDVSKFERATRRCSLSPLQSSTTSSLNMRLGGPSPFCSRERNGHFFLATWQY